VLKPRAVILGALSAVFLSAVALAAVMHGFSRAASWEIQKRPGIEARDHNAIKHAYAAAELYSLLRPIAGAGIASCAVITFGEWNEYAERYVKYTTDWSAEVYKDLRNNIAGVAAAEWLYGEAGYVSPVTRLKLIGKLAQEGVLAAEETDPRIPDLPKSPDTGSALAKMRADQTAVAAEIRSDIAARGAALKQDLGLD
jgi:hypothetical protein